MDRLTNILAATDFSPGSRSALRQAARLAERSGATLHLLHVVGHEVSEELLQLYPEGASVVAGHLESGAREQLEREQAALGYQGETELHIRIGHPVREIVEMVRGLGVDLLVVGVSGESGHSGLGAIATRCVRKAPTMVLLVPRGGEGRFEKIVACVDFSDLSGPVMEAATRLGGLDERPIDAVHVFQMPWERSRWGPPPSDALRLEGEYKALLERRFREGPGALSKGVEVGFELLKSADSGRAIVDYARHHHADLVVVGTTGRSALGYMLLGTTAEKVMRSVGCAVLAVKRDGSSSDAA
jgi:nucleotide-binding universal stress UspA family protein